MMAGLRFSYLLAHPQMLGVSLPHPAALLLLLCIPFLTALARKDFSRHRLALGFRLAAFVLLVLTLAGLAISVRLPNDRLSLIAAVDVSQSIDAQGRRWEQRYLDDVAAALAPGDELGVVAFAKEAKVIAPPAPPHTPDIGKVPITTSATDIGQGLETAMALFAPDAARRLLLISDGNETRGNSLAEIARARRSGVKVYAAVPPHVSAADLAVDKVAAPSLVAEASVFPLRVVLRNSGVSRSGTLSLFVDGQAAGNQQLTLRPGLNAVEIPYRLSGVGTHRLRVQVAADDDPIPGNNYREMSVTVGGATRVLLVTPRSRSSLARGLARKDITVATIKPADFPTQVDDLLSYHCVIFADVAADAFSRRKLDALERYIRDFGGGLIVAGGERTYGDPGFKRTALERMLPVTLESPRPPRAGREALALVLLIDRSNSMGYRIGNRLERSEDESKLAYAKRAALSVVQQLKDTDSAGVIAFDAEPFEVAPLRRLKENRKRLREDIPRLRPGGGTDFYDALESARTQLLASRARTKHVILLTDGDTNRAAADHYPLIAALAKAGISVTTIRIGDDTVNLKLLHDISNRTGGEFYHVEKIGTLPELLLKDTSKAQTQTPHHQERYTPRVAEVSQVLRGIREGFPSLRGYAYSRSKPDADILLSVSSGGKKDPLLDVWQYGLGRVVAFTASLDDEAESWVGWEAFGKFWSQLVHWSAQEHTRRDYALEVHRVDGRTTLRLHAFDDLDDGVLMARVFSDPDHWTDLALAPRAPREFDASLPPLPPGLYPLMVTKRSGTHEVDQRTELIQVPDHDEEPQEEFESDGPNLPLLHELASATGGAVNAPIRSIVGRAAGTRRVDYPLDWLFIPAAMLLFLADVGLRRTSLAP
jgi:Ca-activated chloride channel family protein